MCNLPMESSDTQQRYNDGIEAGKRWAHLITRYWLPYRMRLFASIVWKVAEIYEQQGPRSALSHLKTSFSYGSYCQNWYLAFGDDIDRNSNDEVFMNGFIEGVLAQHRVNIEHLKKNRRNVLS